MHMTALITRANLQTMGCLCGSMPSSLEQNRHTRNALMPCARGHI